MTRIPYVPGKVREKNEARRPPGAFHNCIICGSWIKGEPKAWIHVHDGGSSAVTEAEAAGMGEAADLGLHPIGSSCIRKYPQLRGYVQPT